MSAMTLGPGTAHHPASCECGATLCANKAEHLSITVFCLQDSQVYHMYACGLYQNVTVYKSLCRQSAASRCCLGLGRGVLPVLFGLLGCCSSCIQAVGHSTVSVENGGYDGC